MNNSISFIPVGIALCYCYLTLRESNKTDIKPRYELDFLESLAIIYCIFIASIRANWVFFISILKIGIIAFLVILGWYLLYNLEEFKNVVISIIRQNSLVVENNQENALIENLVSETDNVPEKEIPKQKTKDDGSLNVVEESFSEIDKNLEILIPQIDKIIENFNADTKKYIEFVELEGEKNTAEIPNPAYQFTPEQLVSELERITDNLVLDTKKIADNVCLVSSMIVENSTVESRFFENEHSASIITPRNSKTTINMEDVEMNADAESKTENNIPIPLEINNNIVGQKNEVKEAAQFICKTDNITEIDVVPLDMDRNVSCVHQKSDIEEAEQLICNTENIAESLVNTIASCVETLNK